jgi:hypothetical protein
MKINSMLIAGALSLGFVGAASAQCTVGTATHIYITGSTAFRGATIAAIEGCLSNYNFAAYKCSASFAPYANQEQTAGNVNFYGQLTNDGTCVVIKCSFSGSEAGYVDITKCTTQNEPFMDDTVGGFGVANVLSTANPPNTADSHKVDIGMHDNSQAFAKPANRTPAIVNICKSGIIPFKWVKNAQSVGDQSKSSWADLSNVTHPSLRVAISGGTKASLFTGNAADTNWVYVAGRDNNSGTRANVLLDLGLATTFSVAQTIIGGSDGAPTLGALSSSGQSSGGTLAGTMKFTGSMSAADTINGGTGWIAIAYLGFADAASAISGGAVQLTLNGVVESTPAIQQGQYSYWGQEYCSLANCDSLGSTAGVLWSCMCGKFSSGAAFTADAEIAASTMHAQKVPDNADPQYLPPNF